MNHTKEPGPPEGTPFHPPATSLDANDNIEIQLLLDAVYLKYGYDFRQYARAHLKRRLLRFMSNEKVERFADLQHSLLYDADFFVRFLHDLSVHTTEMFRDPGFYRAFRREVVPMLQTYPSFKIWHAGCSTGEEVYSMAILLEEEGLLDRTMIYATDISERALNLARAGIYQVDAMQGYTRNYQEAGGTASFSDYYTSLYDGVVMEQALSRRIVFASHNLVTDSAFNEMHVVICRNVLIYFDHELQDTVFELFSNSLSRRGFLCLGSKETIRFSTLEGNYLDFVPDQKIYRRTW